MLANLPPASQTPAETAPFELTPRKPYQKPQIMHEMRLETRAGSVPGPAFEPFALLRQYDPRPKNIQV